MPSNINQFDKELRFFAEVQVPQEFNAIVQKLSLEILRRIVIKTPVDTGRARGNWMVAINSIPQGIIEIERLSESQAQAFALSNGIPIIKSAKPFTAISIANNLPYIGVLEMGSSKKAPQGMVRVSLAEIQATFG